MRTIEPTNGDTLPPVASNHPYPTKQDGQDKPSTPETTGDEKKPPVPDRPAQIIRQVCEEHNITLEAFFSGRRFMHLVKARKAAAIAMHKLRGKGQYSPWSLPRIGQYLGGLHHTTVLNYLEGTKVARERRKNCPQKVLVRDRRLSILARPDGLRSGDD